MTKLYEKYIGKDGETLIRLTETTEVIRDITMENIDDEIKTYQARIKILEAQKLAVQNALK